MLRIVDYLVTVMTSLQHHLTMAQYKKYFTEHRNMCSVKYNYELKSHPSVKVPVKYKLSSFKHNGAF